MGRKYRLTLKGGISFIYRDFVALDFETTGLNHKKDKIIEIGAVRVEHGILKDEFTALINPEIPIDENITAITGITPDMVLDKPVIADVINDLELFIGKLPIVAHNAKFDVSFYERALRHRCKNTVIDTLEISRKKLSHLQSRKLAYLAKYFGIPQENEHRAIDDAKAAAQLYIILQGM